MKCTATLAAISAIVLGASASAIPHAANTVVDKRVSGPCGGTCGTVPIAEFHTYTKDECQPGDYYGHYYLFKGQDSPTCESLSSPNVTIHSVSQSFGNLKCQLTVYMNGDCSDAGIPIGAPQGGGAPGCFSDAGGIKAYKVQCPWW
ncbi:hypothetical protein B0H66DRAFT_531969 [Apodospora peruviana]|uniref:Secreted protein n=1 Tax=Apodospora peruviana TaxID=516989 RepID=A0AAE0M982_9PEZI|nr:hypothetical protein B0H66DRAFT_531969 [Apodospora peruviana]